MPEPSNSHADGYTFEFPVKIPTGPGTTTDGRIDLYRRGAFVLEAKQFTAPVAEPSELALALDPAAGKKKAGPVRDTTAWDDAMWRARGQAERYARHLPTNEPPAPFLLVVDVGHSIEVYADFTQAGRAYNHFPDPRNFRIRLADLREPAVRERLRRIWLEPLTLDPAKISAAVTREIAGYLAVLAKSLEAQAHPPKLIAEFLTRCLFCMFAEDVALLPKDGFRGLLESLRATPEGFVPKLRQLFAEMQTGTDYSVILNKKLLRFNGGLFHEASVLPLDGTQLGILIKASQMQWKDVEPAIFGTLLERALNPDERHQLGAHFTPRAYVERLVLPTVIEPLRAEWESVRAAAATLAKRGDMKGARKEVNAFHDRLCTITVLDPACGSGNFLYVALQHLKLLEGEVLDTAAQFGENFKLELETHTIDPHQFLGIELNPRAASIAELVLWIGYLQWHFKIHGERTPPEPVLRAFKNIECRDAVLAWDGEPQPARDERGEIVTVWDRRSMKTDLVTGRSVPDESKRVPLLTYPGARPAGWLTKAHPRVDYIVGNPPFLGNKRMRDDLGDGYTETLRAAYPDVPESADFVMYWWHKAALLVRSGAVQRFGFITTNSLRQTFNRRVVEAHLKGAPSSAVAANGAAPCSAVASDSATPPSEGAAGGETATGKTPVDSLTTRPAKAVSALVPRSATALQGSAPPLSLHFAIPDHPWVDTVDGAAVRIAMTVAIPGTHEGELQTVTAEEPHEDGSSVVTLDVKKGRIAANITTGADVSAIKELKANDGMSNPGVKLHGAGFIVTRAKALDLGLHAVPLLENYLREYRNGKDLTDKPRNVLVIDLFGLSSDEVRQRFPAVYQHVLTFVKPERDSNKRESRRKNWWIFGEPNKELRRMLYGLPRYIVTVETSKHRVFQFLDASILPDNMLIAIALDDAFHLGVLSSRIHVVFSLAAGGRLGVGNDPRYNKTRCFDPFPFPDCDDEKKEEIRKIAEELDAHRKRVQAQHPGLSLTAMYNVLEALREGRPLSKKEQDIHDRGLVSILRQLHDALDWKVTYAYDSEDSPHGWAKLAHELYGLQTGDTLDPVTGWPADRPSDPAAAAAQLAAAQAAFDQKVLTNLVALNATRAAEEAAGKIRWLRPDYQAPAAAQTTLGITAKPGKVAKPAKQKAKKTPWLKPLAERVKATEQALREAATAVTPADLAKRFLRAKPEDLAEILDTLVAMSRAHKEGEKFSV